MAVSWFCPWIVANSFIYLGFCFVGLVFREELRYHFENGLMLSFLFRRRFLSRKESLFCHLDDFPQERILGKPTILFLLEVLGGSGNISRFRNVVSYFLVFFRFLLFEFFSFDGVRIAQTYGK